jgi:ferric enterobactin receptor
MKNFMIRSAFILLGIFMIMKAPVSAQSVLDKKLDQWYMGSLEFVLNQLSTELNVRFSYDLERIKNIEVNKRPFNKPLSAFLTSICHDNRLKYYMGRDSVIYLADLWATEEGQNEKEKLAEKTFDGPPQKMNFNLSGRIMDKKSNESLPYVSLIVRGTGIGTTTNVDGYFTLLHVPSDTVSIDISYIGYKKKVLFLTPSSPLQNLYIEMESQMVNLNEIVVVGEKQEILQANNQVGMIKLSPLKLNTLPNIGEKDVLRSFQLMPGISAANENSSGLYVRGGTPDQSLMLYDGFTVYNVEHLFGFFSTFNSNAIKDVQLYKSGFDAKYGGRLASVVEITGKEGNKKQFNACADVSLMSVNGFVEVPIGDKITTIFAVRRSWKSPVYQKIFDKFTSSDDNTSNSQPQPGGRFGQSETNTVKSYFYDLNSKITYRPSKKDIVAFSIYNGADNLDNSVNPDGMSRMGSFQAMNMTNNDITNWGNTGMSMKWSRYYNPKFYSNVLVSYSNYFSKRDRTSDGSFTKTDGTSEEIKRGILENNNLKDLTAKADFELNLWQNSQLQFGGQASKNNIDYTYKQNDTLTIIDRSTSGNLFSQYLQLKLGLFKNRLDINPGIRTTYYTETKKWYYEPRVNMNLKITNNIKLKASAGKYYQFAKRVVREDIMQGSRDFWVMTDDEKLPVSSSIQYVAGASWENADYLFDVEAYYKDLSNLAEYSLRIKPSREKMTYDEYFYNGTGIAKGVDFLLQKKSGNLNGWVGYTFGLVTSKFPDYGDYHFYASNDVTHEFKVVGTYKYRNWNFGATWVYTTGRPYTAPEGGYQLSLLDGTQSDYINVSIKNGNRLPAYHRMDLTATYNFYVGYDSPMSISISLFNIYNRKNVWYKEYEIIEDEVIETPVHYLGFTPNINITYRFH